jgi:hypothetical protein
MKPITLILAALLAVQSPPRSISAITDDLQRLITELKNRPETITVPCGASIDTAVTGAKGGDTIVLEAGCRYTGGVKLTPESGIVTLRSGGALPNRRVSPADSGVMATIAGGVNGTNAANWKLDGIQLESTATSEIVSLQDVTNITLDRLLIVGGVNGQRRAIRGNGKQITLTRSYIANIWASGSDSQAFCAWDGAGPYTITDNYLEAASENVMFGGSDSASADRVPADILIYGNLFSKRLEWKPIAPAKTSGKVVKNLLELKAAKRVVIRNNTFERSWTDAQTGYGISFKSVNQNGTAPWSATEDVLFEGNTIRDVENGINIQGETFEPNANGTTQHGGKTTGIVIRGNEVQTPGIAVQITGAPGAITLDRTTFLNGYTFINLDGLPIASLTVTNVLANHNAYGVKGRDAGIGLPSLTKFATALTWSNNVLLGGAGKGSYPATTYFDLASVPAGVVVGK